MSNTFKHIGKKALTVGVSIATMAWSIGLASVPIASAAVSGDLIKITCTATNKEVCTAVYYLGANGKRYVFPTEKTYKTWYADFSSVKSISQTEMESYPIGGNATYKPGAKMVKVTTDPKVYAVEKNGTLRWVKTEAIAKTLYGDMWNKMIDDVPDAFFVNYTTGTEVSDATQYNKTTQMAGSATINDDKALSTTSQAGGSTITAALSADTPASGLVFGSAAQVPFTIFTLTASSDGDVVVDSITVERTNPAQDGAFADFDLVDAGTMLSINNLSKSLNSAHQAVFGDDITVKAGTTKKIIIAANMTSGTLGSYAGEVPVLGVAAIILKGGATLVGTLPINGNYQTVNGTLTVGTSTVAAGSNNPSAATKEVGTKDYIVASIKITNNSSATNQDFRVKSLTFTQNGSASPEDLINLRLVNTNTSQTLSTVSTISTKKVNFQNLDVVIKKGENINFDLRTDMKSGSARTISLDIDQKAHIIVYDTLRGFNVLSTYPNTSSPYYNAPDTTIGDGKLRIESLAVKQDKIPENSKVVLLGRFKFVAEGEAINITALGMKLTTTAGGTGKTTNVKLVNAKGATVGGPVDPVTSPAAGTGQETATTTDTITIPVGENEYSVYGDLDSGFAANNTVQVGIFANAITAKGDTSGNTITPTPAGQIQSTSLTVKTAALALSLDSAPSAQTVVAGTTDFEFGRIVFDAADSGSDIRITQVAVAITDVDAMPNIVSGIELYDGNTKIPVDTSTQACSGTTCSTINTRATTTLTITAGNLTIPRATSKVLRVIGDIGTASTTGSFRMQLQGSNVSAIDSEASSITPTYTTAQGSIMTLAAGGTLNVSIATDPKSNMVIAGATTDVGKFSLDAKNEAIKINALGFQVNDPDGGIVGNADEVGTLELWEQGGSSALGSVTVNAARATITPVTVLQVSQNSTKTYIVKVKWEVLLPASSGSPATSGSGARMRLTYVDAKGTSAASSSVTVNPSALDSATGNFNSYTVFKSIPTLTINFFTGADKLTGNVVTDVLKFQVAADAAGPLALVKFTWGVSSTTAALTNAGYYLYESASATALGDLLSDTTDIRVVMAGDTIAVVEARFDVGNDNAVTQANVDDGEHLILSAGTTRYFTLRGTVASHDGTADNESVSVVFAGDAAFAGTAQLNTAAIDGTVNDDDFIWSDLNFDQYSSSTATYTIGWFNGYRIPGLVDTSSSPQTLTD